MQPLQRAGVAQARSNAELAAVLLPMAYLSNVVYHRHEASPDRSDPALACDAGVPGADEAGKAPLQVAIVFRGTENDLRQALGRELHVYAAGHSLGGGLAQQAGYLHRQIRAVYAFNTSAVTNWTQLRLWDGGVHIQNPEPVIVRVGQDREFLEYLRAITSPLTGGADAHARASG